MLAKKLFISNEVPDPKMLASLKSVGKSSLS